MIITRIQIIDCLNNYVRDYIVDAAWHIALVEDFLHLLDGDSFDSDKLKSAIYVKSIIESNKKNEYARKILMYKSPETYISALFDIITLKIQEKSFLNGILKTVRKYEPVI